MRPVIQFAAFLAVFALFSSHTARAQSANCGPRAAIVELLSERFGESQVLIAITADNRVVETFVSPERGTWTILVTNAEGRACLLLFGEAWEIFAITKSPEA